MYGKIVGVEVKFRNALYEVLIYPRFVPELLILEVTNKGLIVGGAVTLSELREKLQELITSMPGVCHIWWLGWLLMHTFV